MFHEMRHEKEGKKEKQSEMKGKGGRKRDGDREVISETNGVAAMAVWRFSKPKHFE